MSGLTWLTVPMMAFFSIALRTTAMEKGRSMATGTTMPGNIAIFRRGMTGMVSVSMSILNMSSTLPSKSAMREYGEMLESSLMIFLFVMAVNLIYIIYKCGRQRCYYIKELQNYDFSANISSFIIIIFSNLCTGRL